MSTEEKFRWLVARFPGGTPFLAVMLLKASTEEIIITKSQYIKLMDIYGSAKKSWTHGPLDLMSLKHIKSNSKMILVVNLLYNLVKKHDNRGKKTIYT